MRVHVNCLNLIDWLQVKANIVLFFLTCESTPLWLACNDVRKISINWRSRDTVLYLHRIKRLSQDQILLKGTLFMSTFFQKYVSRNFRREKLGKLVFFGVLLTNILSIDPENETKFLLRRLPTDLRRSGSSDVMLREKSSPGWDAPQNWPGDPWTSEKGHRPLRAQQPGQTSRGRCRTCERPHVRTRCQKTYPTESLKKRIFDF